MMYPIVASDLDGTLLTEQHALSPFSQHVLKELTEKGVHFIFATGRHYVDVLQKKNELGIPAFMVTSNGASVHDADGNLILEQNLPAHLVFPILKLGIDEPHVFSHIFQEQDWLINRDDPSTLQWLQEDEFHYQVTDLFTSDPNIVRKVFFTIPDIKYRTALERLKVQIERHFGGQVDVMFSSLFCLDIMKKGVNKGSALQFITERLNHTLKDVIAFGDSMNDYEMLSSVGKGFLMENANPDLKAALPNLPRIGRNSDEAVPHYLHSFYHL